VKRCGALLICLWLGLAALPLAGALELEQGNIRLVLHEGIGRFSLYTRTPQSGNAFVALFVDQDPRTSGLSVLIDDRIIRLGEGGEFQERVERTADGARFVWEARRTRITESFLPISSSRRPEADAVLITVTVANLSSASISAGVRFCLDTYLGEENLAHFVTDGQQEIRAERTITRQDMLRYWVSPSARYPDSLGLMSVTEGELVTVPDRIVFANWKRLSEASWLYETSSNRNFNLMPYSINDSAVCQYYDAAPIAPQAERKVSLILGNVSQGGLALAGPQASATAPALATPSTAPPEAPPPPEAGGPEAGGLGPGGESPVPSIRTDLAALDDLLRSIDEKLSSGQQISAEEARLMRDILSAIKERTER
jgi:hypothetical protein